MVPLFQPGTEEEEVKGTRKENRICENEWESFCWLLRESLKSPNKVRGGREKRKTAQNDDTFLAVSHRM